MYLLVLAHPGCPGHSLESRKMVVVVVVMSLSFSEKVFSNFFKYSNKIVSVHSITAHC